MLLKYSKMRNVKSPERGHATDAGIDFYCPVFDETFKDDVLSKPSNQSGVSITEDKLIIEPNHNITIPSGIKVEIPYGYMGLLLNKSGIASNYDMIVGAQVIDTFYNGEVHIDLHNVGKKNFVITQGMKLVQMVLTPVLSTDLTEVEEDDLYEWMKQDSYRGAGGFGSTGG
jgi:dUTP pyrophosphatase